jgi:hypothetical protein
MLTTTDLPYSNNLLEPGARGVEQIFGRIEHGVFS